MPSRPGHQPFSRGIPAPSDRFGASNEQTIPFAGRGSSLPQPAYPQRSLTELSEGYPAGSPPFSGSSLPLTVHDYTQRTSAARADPYQISYLPPGGIPIASPERGAPFGSSSFAQIETQQSLGRSESQHGYPGNYGGHDVYGREPDSPSTDTYEFSDDPSRRRGTERGRGGKFHSQRKPTNRDEFDGPHQLLDPPSPRTITAQERELPHLQTNLDVQEQDDILSRVNDILSKCAFDFVAKYQFPIPLEADKRQVRVPSDREWTEWVYLLKRLATKRRIPARVLYNNQIKQLVTVLENSLEMRHAAKHQSRPLKDDRNVLQLISAGIQVAKILKDATAMEFLDQLYVRTEIHIQERRDRNRRGFAG